MLASHRRQADPNRGNESGFKVGQTDIITGKDSYRLDSLRLFKHIYITSVQQPSIVSGHGCICVFPQNIWKDEVMPIRRSAISVTANQPAVPVVLLCAATMMIHFSTQEINPYCVNAAVSCLSLRLSLLFILVYSKNVNNNTSSEIIKPVIKEG